MNKESKEKEVFYRKEPLILKIKKIKK